MENLGKILGRKTECQKELLNIFIRLCYNPAGAMLEVPSTGEFKTTLGKIQDNIPVNNPVMGGK